MPVHHPLKYFKTEYKTDPENKHKHHLKIYYLDEFGGIHIQTVIQDDSKLRRLAATDG